MDQSFAQQHTTRLTLCVMQSMKCNLQDVFIGKKKMFFFDTVKIRM